MVRFTSFGAYSLLLAKEAVKEFFLPMVWVASFVRRTSSADAVQYKDPASSAPLSPAARERFNLVVNLLFRHTGLIAALLVIVGTVLWFNRQLGLYQRQIEELRASERQLTALTDEIFREIDTIARREGGPSHVRLKGCGKLGEEIQCIFEIDASSRFNIFLERGTRLVDEHGNKYFAANSVSAISSSDYSSVSMGPGGVVVVGPAMFRIKFRGVRAETDNVVSLSMLAAEKEGFIVYQFRNIPLVKR
jgi:hypothetical protein